MSIQAIATITGPTEEPIEIIALTSAPAQYGHKVIGITIRYNGKTRAFQTLTDNMPEYDRITEIEDDEDKAKEMYNFIRRRIDPQIVRFIWEENKPKTLEIDRDMAKSIVEANGDYIRWNDGTLVLAAEIVTYFMLEIFANGRVDLVHRLDGYRIEQIKFS